MNNPDGSQPWLTPHRIQQIMTENCAVRSIFSAVAGGALGVFWSLLVSGGGPFAPYQPSDAAKMKVMATLKEMGRNAKFYAKQFSLIGLLFSGSECAIEQIRGKSDLYNGLTAGCFTGAALAWNTGPMNMAFGCAGFAAFSLVIDHLTQGKDPREEILNMTDEEIDAYDEKRRKAGYRRPFDAYMKKAEDLKKPEPRIVEEFDDEEQLAPGEEWEYYYEDKDGNIIPVSNKDVQTTK